ncbi:hypothetical protein AAE02nite_13850 [Adhaeribacter aerolatus]|uniref:Calcineurin-like phosphoesterase domain-containing protein n=2 Tax=Adhaeribacter aerolatus TaxID=670289 RepID=A0A512AVH3_9BACT|nr:hypothetical protein AAE02nite_13850 [Adhaeribacter aerolatus]
MRYRNKLPHPGLLRGPYLQAATSTSMLIRWRTDALSRSRVRYGTTAGNLDKMSSDSALVLDHQVKLTGLLPRTKYYYSIGAFTDTLQGDENNYFMTLPVPGEEGKYRIGIFGDCGTNNVQQRTVRDQFVKYLGNNYMDSWILLGDNSYENGTDAQYQPNFFNVYKDNLLKKYPLFPAPGNHDYGNIDFPYVNVPNRGYDIAYYQNFSMPIAGESGGVPSNNPAFYSFDIGNIHFLSLDSYGRESKSAYKMYDTLSEQAQWVKRDLEANKNKGWVVAYWHHPPYTMGTHDSDKEADLIKIRTDFIRILERYKVDLIICGHSHVYERSKLMQGHFGPEATFNAKEHNLNQSTALYNGTDNACPYIKDAKNDAGTVYVVTGSAGKLGTPKATYPHDAMFYSNATMGGASMLEVEGNRLDFKWIAADGVIRDQFTMMKEVNKKTKIKVKRGKPVTLTASFNGKYSWTNSPQTSKSIQVSPPVGTTTYTVKDQYNCVRDVFEVKVTRF